MQWFFLLCKSMMKDEMGRAKCFCLPAPLRGSPLRGWKSFELSVALRSECAGFPLKKILEGRKSLVKKCGAKVRLKKCPIGKSYLRLFFYDLPLQKTFNPVNFVFLKAAPPRGGWRTVINHFFTNLKLLP
jgi:hypothetical protein